MIVHQRGMQINRVRHHRGAEDRRGHQHGVSTLEARHETSRRLSGIRRCDEQSGDESEGDDQQHHDDDAFEQSLRSATLEPQHHRGDRADHQAAREQRQTEQQLQRDRAADHLGQIGGDGDDLRLGEEHEPTGVTHPLPQQLRQRFAGHDAEFRRLILDEHAHRVGEHQHPHQQITVTCARSDVGRHIARIHIGHGRHERRSEDAGERMPLLVLLRALRVAPFLVDLRFGEDVDAIAAIEPLTPLHLLGAARTTISLALAARVRDGRVIGFFRAFHDAVVIQVLLLQSCVPFLPRTGIPRQCCGTQPLRDERITRWGQPARGRCGARRASRPSRPW